MTETQRPPADEQQQTLFTQEPLTPDISSLEDLILPRESIFTTHKNILPWAATGVAAAALAAGGAFMAIRWQESNETTALESSEFTAPGPETTSIQPENSNNFGNTFTVNKIIPGEPTITATRPNGESIQIPKLRDPATSSPQQVAESALALLTCYVTTGDEVCLKPFTQSPQLTKRIRGMYTDITRYYLDAGTSKNLQTTFYSETPVEFERQGSRFYMSSPSGVQMNLTTAYEWQGQSKLEGRGLPYYPEEGIWFEVQELSNGSLAVTDGEIPPSKGVKGYHTD